MAARLQALARTITGPGLAASTASRPILAATTRNAQIQQQHRMASSTTAEVRKYEWLVVIPDKPGMMAKRLEVRPQHFEGLTKAKESGLFKMGGAILEDMPADDEVSSMKFAGSTVIVVAESRQAVVDALKDDVYVKSGVWDLEKAMIWPAKIAFRFP
ncbi:hypothetical protein N0V93_000657 [Gnomoniopsis smithogilvyi]|uniref:YCII-related domain-containing protein n=1 Tax=Gnomoniopsis smithogilvyi TaxID=1191159 RepID=A0A9W9D0X7_9PEZI|nr:hypothetical protein N0V93_000657 [Gnomoniopsis smithogilvyi]